MMGLHPAHLSMIGYSLIIAGAGWGVASWISGEPDPLHRVFTGSVAASLISSGDNRGGELDSDSAQQSPSPLVESSPTTADRAVTDERPQWAPTNGPGCNAPIGQRWKCLPGRADELHISSPQEVRREIATEPSPSNVPVYRVVTRNLNGLDADDRAIYRHRVVEGQSRSRRPRVCRECVSDQCMRLYGCY
jgi:hypothetical protein